MNTKKLQHVIDIQLFITILRSDYLRKKKSKKNKLFKSHLFDYSHIL